MAIPTLYVLEITGQMQSLLVSLCFHQSLCFPFFPLPQTLVLFLFSFSLSWRPSPQPPLAGTFLPLLSFLRSCCFSLFSSS